MSRASANRRWFVTSVNLTVLVLCVFAAGCTHECPIAKARAKATATASSTVTTSTAGVAPSATGTFRGTVKWSGAIVNRPPLIPKGDSRGRDEYCASTGIPDETLLVDSESRGLANVFVYLREPPAGFHEAAPTEPLKLEIRNCRFSPHVSIARVGQPVEIHVRDPIRHNLHWNAVRNVKFGQVVAPNIGVFKETFLKPERIPTIMTCDLHPWMAGRCLIQDHPFAAITNAKGEFAIPNLPPGNYQFIVWHERSGYLIRNLAIEIGLGKTTTHDLEVNEKQISLE